jgi:hypothetical protein
MGSTVFLCPVGVNPMAGSSGSSTGSGSSGPDGTTTAETTTNNDPTSRCVIAAVVNYPGDQLDSIGPTTITVSDTVAHVDPDTGAAWADLGGGLTAVARAPESAHLSAADLAALVASVRLSPAVTVLPMTTPQLQVSAGYGVATVVSSAAATAESVGVTATAAPAPEPASSTAATDRSGASQTMPPAVSASAAAEESSAAAAATSAQRAAAVAQQRVVLSAYLEAVKQGECSVAERYFIGEPYNGDLCHLPGLRLLDYRIDGGPATPSPDEADFAVTITITGGDQTMPDGDLLWFFDLHRQPGGSWRITGAGSGP